MSPGILLMVIVSTTLVLRSGDRIDVAGPVRQVDGQVIFRVPGGPLYSLPASEIDEEATRTLEEERRNAETAAPRRLKVTPEERDRLLAELSKNRDGQQPLPQSTLTNPPASEARTSSPKIQGDEWHWRRQSRAYEETVRRAEENLELLQSRAAELDFEIRGLLSLGYEPRQFSYQTTVLANTRAQIPAAQLAITQARRAFDQFREDARRQGVLPGWLR